MANPLDRLNLPDEEELAEFCAQYPIQRLAVFGSALREDFSEKSDLDVLVEFAPDARVGLMLMARISRELSDLVGREVDLMTSGFLSPHFRERVVNEAVVWFEKAA